MESTNRKATSGMVKFVLALIVLGAAIALVYLFILTPGEVQPTSVITP